MNYNPHYILWVPSKYRVFPKYHERYLTGYTGYKFPMFPGCDTTLKKYLEEYYVLDNI